MKVEFDKELAKVSLTLGNEVVGFSFVRGDDKEQEEVIHTMCRLLENKLRQVRNAVNTYWEQSV